MPGLIIETSGPTLRQMFADPIIKAVMARDGLTSADVLATMRQAQIRLADKRPDTRRLVSMTVSVPASIEGADLSAEDAFDRRLQWSC